MLPVKDPIKKFLVKFDFCVTVTAKIEVNNGLGSRNCVAASRYSVYQWLKDVELRILSKIIIFILHKIIYLRLFWLA
jgi:hypothetical protein